MVRVPFAFALAGAFAVTGLSGCVGVPDLLDRTSRSPAEPAGVAQPLRAWQPGNWWAYDATFGENRTYSIALIVFEAQDDHYTLGSNLSAGFFGLPYNGNVTRPGLNPVVAGEEWRLFEFPLAHGKTWQHEFLGYRLSTTAREETLDAPGVGAHRGFVLESRAYGRLVAEYTFSPATGWFTRLAIFEPTDGSTVVSVALAGFGRSYEDDYYVERPLFAYHTDYPSLRGPETFRIERNYVALTGIVAIQGMAGEFRMTLEDPRGRPALSGAVHVQGVFVERRSLDPAPGAWSLEHAGIGQGSLHVEILAVESARGTALPAPGSAPPLLAFPPAVGRDPSPMTRSSALLV